MTYSHKVVMEFDINPIKRLMGSLSFNGQWGPDTFPFTGQKDSTEGTLFVSDVLRVFSIRTLQFSKVSVAI